MQIAHYDSSKLEITAGWRGTLIIIVGTIFMVASCFMATLFLPGATLTCSRAEPNTPQCQITKTFLGFSYRTDPIGRLQGARLDISDDGEDETYRVTVVTSSGQWSQGLYSSDWGPKHQTVERIQSFLADPSQQTLEVAIGPSGMGLVGGILMTAVSLLAGGLCVAGGIQIGSLKWTFDRLQNVAIHQRQTLTGQPRTDHYPLDDIVDVKVQTSRASKRRTYRAALVTRDGDTIPLTQSYSNVAQGQFMAAVEAIREVLGESQARSAPGGFWGSE